MEPSTKRVQSLTWAEVRARTLPLRRHKIGPAAYLCYLELFFLSGGVAGTVTVTLAELGAAFCKSARAADKWIAALAEAGLVEVVDSDRGTLRVFVEDPESIELPTRVEASPQRELFSDFSETDVCAQKGPDESAQKGPDVSARFRPREEKGDSPQVIAFAATCGESGEKHPDRHDVCDDVTSLTSTSLTSGNPQEGGNGLRRLGGQVAGVVDALVAATAREVADDPLPDHFLVGKPPDSPEIARWAKRTHVTFLQMHDRGMQEGFLVKLGRAIAAGQLPYGEFARIFHQAVEGKRSGRVLHLGRFFVGSITQRCDELGVDLDRFASAKKRSRTKFHDSNQEDGKR